MDSSLATKEPVGVGGAGVREVEEPVRLGLDRLHNYPGQVGKQQAPLRKWL